jgi:c-di-GMP-related signal transduction protein
VPNWSAASARALEGPKCINLRYVARQPISDRDENFFYELLFRDDMDNIFDGGDSDAAGPRCSMRRPPRFLNCTRETLIGGLVTLLPSHSTVIEILETVPCAAEVTSLPAP